MFTLSELEIEFLKALDIEARTDEFFDKVNQESFKHITSNSGSKISTDGVNYTYSCGSITIIININEKSIVGTRKSITVIKDDMKYVLDFVDPLESGCYDAIQIQISIGNKDSYMTNRETISMSFSPLSEYDNDDEKNFLKVSLRNSNYGGLDTVSITCSQSFIRIRKSNTDMYNDVLTSENYEGYLNVLVCSIKNTVIGDEFSPFIQFFQSVAPSFLINREIGKKNKYYNKRVDHSNAKFEEKLARNPKAKPGVIKRIDQRRESAEKRINDDRDAIVGKYDKLMKVFDPSSKRNGIQIKVYSTDKFEE